MKESKAKPVDGYYEVDDVTILRDAYLARENLERDENSGLISAKSGDANGEYKSGEYTNYMMPALHEDVIDGGLEGIANCLTNGVTKKNILIPVLHGAHWVTYQILADDNDTTLLIHDSTNIHHDNSEFRIKIENLIKEQRKNFSYEKSKVYKIQIDPSGGLRDDYCGGYTARAMIGLLKNPEEKNNIWFECGNLNHQDLRERDADLVNLYDKDKALKFGVQNVDFSKQVALAKLRQEQKASNIQGMVLSDLNLLNEDQRSQLWKILNETIINDKPADEILNYVRLLYKRVKSLILDDNNPLRHLFQQDSLPGTINTVNGQEKEGSINTHIPIDDPDGDVSILKIMEAIKKHISPANWQEEILKIDSGHNSDDDKSEIESELDKKSGREGSYKLTRSDSNMTNYTDLLSEMMDDQIDNFNPDADKERSDDYELFSVKTKSPEIDKIKQNLKNVKEPLRKAKAEELDKQDKEANKEFKTPANKNARNTREYKKTYSSSQKIVDLEQQLKKEKTKAVDSPISKEQEDQTLHLFRGKALNSTKLDKDGKVVKRSSDEIKDMITLKHKGITLKSDGLINNPEREEKIKNETRGYLMEIKAKAQIGEISTALFNAGKVYDSAVKELMTRTEAKGNTVVASSKLPWVAAEYEAGNMGGAAGGDRAVPYGYTQDKKPVGRVLGNGYAISISMADYVQLRQDGDLVDVNVDVGKGVKVNQMIEEVTFNAEIPGKMVKGNLPMVLPRFDREYNKMTEEKQAKYKKVFNLDKEKYNEYRNLFLQKGDETDVPLGIIVEHLIMHHGFLLREIAINSDRSSGLEGKFMIPRNELYQSKNINDIRLTGTGLAERNARLDNAKVKTKYIEQRAPDPKKTKEPSLGNDKELKQGSPIKPKKLIFSSPSQKMPDHKDDLKVEALGESLGLFMSFQSKTIASTKNEKESDLKEPDNQKTPTNSPTSDISVSPLRSKMGRLGLNKD